MDKTKSIRVSSLLSVQRTLFGEIIPVFRRISVEYSVEEIKVWVYYDGEIDSDEIEEFSSTVIAEVGADFPYPELGDPNITYEFVRVDYPKKIKAHGWTVYGRRERT